MSTSDFLVVVQAIAAAVSAATAVYLVAITVNRDREIRAERDRDVAHEQLGRLVSGMRALGDVLGSDDQAELDFDIARAQIAAALALRPVNLSACEALIADDMPTPPYALGNVEPYVKIEAALTEIRVYARTL